MVSKLRLHELDCPDCAGKLEKKIQSMPGVDKVDLNFFLAKMIVSHQLTEITILQAVEDAGHRATLLHDEDKMVSTVDRGLQWRALLAVAAAAVGLGFYPPALIVAMIVGGWLTYQKAFLALIKRRLDMNVLMSTAVLGAVIIGEWQEGALVAVLFAISQWLEARSMQRARQSVRSLMETAPDEALVRRDGEEMTLPLNQLMIGDLIVVRSGAKLPIDGVVETGHSFVNQAAITGESIPIEKQQGDPVYAGTINQNGRLEVRMNKEPQNSTLAQIVRLVEEAQGQKTPVQAFVDRFASVYTPIVLTIAAGTVLLGPVVGLTWDDSVYRALSLLVVACPCALVLASPITLVAAMGNAAKHGIMVKSGVSLEKAGSISQVVFDKTGTLTYGRPQVTSVWMDPECDENLVGAVTWGVEQGTNHAAASALKDFFHSKVDRQVVQVHDLTDLPGIGVKGIWEQNEVLLVQPRYAAEKLGLLLPSEVEVWQQQGAAVSLLIVAQKVWAVYGITDRPREAAGNGIRALTKLGITPWMLTGDSAAAAEEMAGTLGIARYEAELMPEDKLNRVKSLSKQKLTAMVGDGINDGPALAAADLGIAMGAIGTDLALDSADIVLMTDNLGALDHLFSLGKAAGRIVKQNIGLALALKVLALLLIVPGWLTLWLAVVADMGASLIVTLNGLRLWRFRSNHSRRWDR